MYVDSCTYRRKEKTYSRHLLRTSFRVDGKVRHKTIANISHLPEDEIEVLRTALRRNRKRKITDSRDQVSVSLEDVENAPIMAGAKLGPLFVLDKIARRLGLHAAMGNSKMARLSLWLVYARLLGCESRLAAARAAKNHSVDCVLGLGAFDEDDLYAALDWLEGNQLKIEDKMNAPGLDAKSECVFLYDVTSSYFEGKCNELAAFGYNRDGKRGKMQIVIGLLTDAAGEPLSVEVFEGNTCDTETCNDKIDEIKKRFSAERIVLVGDRGMIKQPQIDKIHESGAETDASDGPPVDSFNYVTAISKPQIETLLRSGAFQLDMFDEQVHEVVIADVRYVLRRNPVRAAEIADSRDGKLSKTQAIAKARNTYLTEHPRAKEAVALRITREWITKLKAGKWLRATASERKISIEVDESALAAESKLDGCYVIKTDIKEKEFLTARQAHDLYKDLAHVEWAFRTFKTDLENRPIFVRKEKRTRGHIFTVMLAYKLLRELRRQIAPHKKELLGLLFDGPYSNKQTITHKDIIEQLGMIIESEIEIAGVIISKITEPGPVGARILEILDIKIPATLLSTTNVSTTQKTQRT